MQSKPEYGRMLTVKGGWLLCPQCGGSKVLRIWPDTYGRRIQVYCKRCRHETTVNIDPQCLCHECPCR